MSQIKLIKPTLAYAEDIMTYKQEFLDAGDSMDGCGSLPGCDSAEEWIQELNLLEKPDTGPAGKVPSTTYLAIRPDDNKLVGIIDLRHHIDHPILGLWGGHIGYSVRPSERRKGYATEMLRQNLFYCKEYELEKVMVTCTSDNIASKKAILANGGILEKEISVDGEKIERYWIDK